MTCSDVVTGLDQLSRQVQGMGAFLMVATSVAVAVLMFLSVMVFVQGRR